MACPRPPLLSRASVTRTFWFPPVPAYGSLKTGAWRSLSVDFRRHQANLNRALTKLTATGRANAARFFVGYTSLNAPTDCLRTRDGWRCGINTVSSIFTARNWLIQTNGAAIFRYAGLLMRSLDLPVIGLVHDAVLLEVDV